MSVFRFVPDDKVNVAFAYPGPDTTPGRIISDDGGDSVVVNRQIPFKSAWETVAVSRRHISWTRGDPVSVRFNEWKQEK